MSDTKLVTAPSFIHTANVFLPGCLGPVKREVVLAEDHHELIAGLIAENEALRKDAERYRWMRDCPWPGHMQAVGISSIGNDAYWLAGDEADRAVDAEMGKDGQS